MSNRCIKKICPNPYFTALSLQDAETDIDTWMIYKIVNTINLMRLIKSALLMEEDVVKNKQDKKLSSTVNEISKFIETNIFIEKMLNRINSQIKLIIDKMEQPTVERLDEVLTRYNIKKIFWPA